MSIPNRSLPLMIDVEGHPYLIEAGEVDLLPSGVPAPENIYPQLPPSWEAPSPVVPVEHGETLCIMGRRFQVNMIGDLELVALALPGESEYEAPAAPAPDDTDAHDHTCAACHAAHLIADALTFLKPDESTITSADVIDCGTVRLSVLSDDAGAYIATLTVDAEAF